MQDRVEFLGHVIYRDTIMPSETKVAAIRMCPTPRSKTELRTFLGSVNYLSKFIPELQAKCAVLYQLCGKNNIWKWTAEHDTAFEVVKEAMLNARVLQPFNIAAEVHIASDTSESGLSAVMFQKATNGKMMPVSLVNPELKQIRRYLESGWPNGCNQWVTTYRSRAHELSSEDGILLWLQRIVIPTSLRQKAAQVLHTGYPGINPMKELARRYCWWPSIETDIEHTVGTCQLCQSRRNATPKVPLHQWDVPMQPCERLHVDCRSGSGSLVHISYRRL
ncbi:hypothetical protein GJ496_001691 [Pomphorhynchus laevis]|nr:hypothetical protein GJ496_001691 [Pomphorhynchus laevis]